MISSNPVRQNSRLGGIRPRRTRNFGYLHPALRRAPYRFHAGAIDGSITGNRGTTGFGGVGAFVGKDQPLRRLRTTFSGATETPPCPPQQSPPRENQPRIRRNYSRRRGDPGPRGLPFQSKRAALTGRQCAPDPVLWPDAIRRQRQSNRSGSPSRPEGAIRRCPSSGDRTAV